VRLKADIIQLNLPHEPNIKMWKTGKLKCKKCKNAKRKKADTLRSIGKQCGESSILHASISTSTTRASTITSERGVSSDDADMSEAGRWKPGIDQMLY